MTVGRPRVDPASCAARARALSGREPCARRFRPGGLVLLVSRVLRGREPCAWASCRGCPCAWAPCRGCPCLWAPCRGCPCAWASCRGRPAVGVLPWAFCRGRSCASRACCRRSDPGPAREATASADTAHQEWCGLHRKHQPPLRRRRREATVTERAERRRPTCMPPSVYRERTEQRVARRPPAQHQLRRRATRAPKPSPKPATSTVTHGPA